MIIRSLCCIFVPVLVLSLCTTLAEAQELVLDLATSGGSGISDFFSSGDELYFSASDGVHSREPWKYTESGGAVMIADLNKGLDARSSPTGFTRVGDYLYFGADAGGDVGRELWRYDGTNPPVVVANLAPGSDCSCPINLTEFQGSLIFTSGIGGPSHIWEVADDGAPEQPFPNDPSGTSPDDFLHMNDVLYYTAENDQQNRTIWRFDGSNPPEIVLPGADWHDVRSLTAFDGGLVFTAGNHMWSWDGTTDPIELTSSAFGNDFPNGPHSYTEFDGRLYFSGFDPDHHYELWVWDGVGEPELAADVVPDDETDPRNFVELNGNLYFQGLGSVWRYDGVGSPAAVEELSVAYQSSMVVHDGRIFYLGRDERYGAELWSWNGVDAPVLVADINRSASTNPDYLHVHDGAVYFSAEAYPQHLLRYDGSQLHLIEILDDSDHSVAPVGLTTWNDAVYFLAMNDGPSNSRVAPRDIFRYDSGDTAEFQARINFNESGAGTYPDELVAGGDRLYFTGHDGTNGYELWSWDGSNAPGMVADIEPGSGSSDPKFFTWFDGALYFKAETSSDGEALWRYVPGEGAELFHETNIQVRPFIHEGNLYFTHGKLWSYDGETDPVIVETSALAYPNARSFASLNGALYFGTHELSGRSYLFVVDGAASPDSVDLGGATSTVDDLAVIGDAVCFRGTIERGTRQLWCHDTESGETRAFEINPFGSSDPMSFALLGEHLYFAADDGVSGRELWRISESVATHVEAGGELPRTTAMTVDVYPNPVVSSTTVSVPDAFVHGAEIEIFDILGRRTGISQAVRPRASGSSPTVRLDLSSLPPGVYFVRVRGDGIGVTRPVVKSR